VAHYGVITKDPRLDCVLTFVDDGDEADAADWGVGEVGGFEAYLLADEDKEGAAAADTYRQVRGGRHAGGSRRRCFIGGAGSHNAAFDLSIYPARVPPPARSFP